MAEEPENILEILQLRRDQIQKIGKAGKQKRRGRSTKECLKDPVLSEVVEKVRLALREVPDIRKDRVETVKRQLQEGTFEPDPKSVAEKLLQEAILSEIL